MWGGGGVPRGRWAEVAPHESGIAIPRLRSRGAARQNNTGLGQHHPLIFPFDVVEVASE